MEKTHRLMMLMVGLVAVLGSEGRLWHSRCADEPLNCIDSMEWNIGSNRFTSTLSFRMYNSEGLATTIDKLYRRDTSDISRNIYFNYTQKRDVRVLQVMQVVKTFADTADETDINDTLPGFYRQSGRSLSLVMEEYKGVWIFASSNAPSLCCRER